MATITSQALLLFVLVEVLNGFVLCKCLPESRKAGECLAKTIHGNTLRVTTSSSKCSVELAVTTTEKLAVFKEASS